MKVHSSEVASGIVVCMYFGQLLADKAVAYFNGHTGRGSICANPRPFICVCVTGEASTWAPTTSQWRPERVFLHPAWRSGGEPQWRATPSYLLDGAALLRGPTERILEASSGERTTPATRAWLSHDGVVAVLQEIKKQSRRRVLLNAPIGAHP